MADLQSKMDFLCPECCSCLFGRSLPETVAIKPPLLTGVSRVSKACIVALVRYVGSGNGMARFVLLHLLFLGRFFAGGVGGAHQSACNLSCL